jgi:hypothetical protein
LAQVPLRLAGDGHSKLVSFQKIKAVDIRDYREIPQDPECAWLAPESFVGNGLTKH